MTDGPLVAGWWYWPALWFTIVLGLVPSLYFLATWRPKRYLRPRLRELDAAGWVLAIVLLYVSAAIRAFVGYPPPTRPVAVSNLAIGLLVDALLVVRGLHWRTMRRAFRGGPPRRRATDVDVRDSE